MGNDIVAASAAQERLMAGRGAARVEPRRSVSGGMQQTQLSMRLCGGARRESIGAALIASTPGPVRKGSRCLGHNEQLDSKVVTAMQREAGDRRLIYDQIMARRAIGWAG
jgi:hypothetical protein